MPIARFHFHDKKKVPRSEWRRSARKRDALIYKGDRTPSPAWQALTAAKAKQERETERESRLFMAAVHAVSRSPPLRATILAA